MSATVPASYSATLDPWRHRQRRPAMIVPKPGATTGRQIPPAAAPWCNAITPMPLPWRLALSILFLLPLACTVRGTGCSAVVAV